MATEPPPIDPRKIFQQYRDEQRRHEWPGFRLEQLPHLSRHVAEGEGMGGIVTFADLEPAAAIAAIQHEIAYFARLGRDFEWKVYDFDSPPDLKEILQGLGFLQDDEEAFLVLKSADWPAPTRIMDGLTIKRITEPDQLRDFVAVEQAVWPQQAISWHVQHYADLLARDPNSVSLYCAYVDDTPVGAGRVSFKSESKFVDLNGGGVVAPMRGRGIFTALLTHRIEEARARGYEWISVDAAPMSRPILLRKGFQHVCWTYPMIYRYARPAGVT